MKKIYIYLIAVLIVLSVKADAQVNYLFSACSKPYVPVTGGISPHMVTNNPSVWEVADEGYANIPIGFTFKYNKENYTQANVCVNGFITLGSSSLDIIFPNGYILNGYPYFQNKLAASPPYNKRPVIAAFWDDLVLQDSSDLVYKTTGIAPFRVFTIEWKKAKWVFESLGPVLSIELKLYETTNIIEFHYKDEGTLPDPRYAFASIGITSAWANRDFISLQNTSANPTISLIKSNDSLAVKPANNQVYKFIPSLIEIPKPIEPSLKFTNKKVSFDLQANAFNSFEYAISQSPIIPASGIKTFTPHVTISSLTPSTTYYLYARTKLFNLLYSQWTCTTFKTASDPLSLPYLEDFETVSDPTYFPENMRQQDFNDTSYYYSPSYNAFAAAEIFPGNGNSMYNNYFTDYYDLNAWAFTPGFNLKANKTYELKFSYGSFSLNDPLDEASLEIKYGKASGAAGMNAGTLFTKSDINNSVDLTDSIISFSPPSNGVYYFGFHDKSLFTKAALVIDNISIRKISIQRVSDTENDLIKFSASLYPNPVLDDATLSFDLQNKSRVTISVYDLLGKKLISVCDQEFEQGLNSITLQTKGLTSGFYNCVLMVDGNIITKKLVKN